MVSEHDFCWRKCHFWRTQIFRKLLFLTQFQNLGLQCEDFFKQAQFYKKKQRKTGTFSALKRALNGQNYKISTKKIDALKKKAKLLPWNIFNRVALSNRLLFDFIKYIRYWKKLLKTGRITEKWPKNGQYYQNARLNGHARFKTGDFGTLGLGQKNDFQPQKSCSDTTLQ